MAEMITTIVRDGASDPAVRLTEVEAPEAAPGEVVIEVRASSVNRGELFLLGSRDDGWRPGQDLAGIVVEEDPGGSGPAAGTAVFGRVDGGAWSERVAAPVGRVAELPDGVSFEAAAGLGIAGLTALRVVRRAGPVLGKRVLITAPGGGVGPFITRLTELSGGVVGTDPDDGPYAAVLDGVGGRMISRGLEALEPGGSLILYGASDPEPAALGLADFFGHENATIRPFQSYAAEEDDAEDLAILGALVADGALESAVAASFELERTSEAIERLGARGIRGKVIIRPTA